MSQFELSTGRVRQGPAVYDQPRHEVRATSDGALEARRVPLGEAASAQRHADGNPMAG
jgi:hypothetical protein